MSATFSNPPSPAPLRPLAIAMVAAAMGHLLFIEGLPRLSTPEVASLSPEVMETRIIMAPPPTEAPPSDMETLQEPPAVPEPAPPEHTPAPEPPAPPPAPETAPEPVDVPEPVAAPEPAAPAEVPPPTEVAPPPAPAQAPPPAPAPTGPSLRSLSEQTSMIDGVPKISFGGTPTARAIPPMLSGQQTETVLQHMAQAIDGKAKLARPTDLVYETRYQRAGNAIAGRSTLAWRHDERYYDARWTELNTQLGNHSYRATGAVAAQGLAPVTGLSERQPSETTRFNYSSQQAQITRNAPDSTPRNVAFVSGTQDPISAMLHLGSLIGGQPERFSVGTRIRVPVLLEGQVREWVFTVEAQTTLNGLKNQDMPVLHLVHRTPLASDSANPLAPRPPASAASAAQPSASAASAPTRTASSQAIGLDAAAIRLDHTGPNDIARLDLWLGPTVDFLPVQWRIETFNGNVTQHVLRSAVEQKVLQSLPPPRDRLPGEALPPPVAPPQPASPLQSNFPESGGG